MPRPEPSPKPEMRNSGLCPLRMSQMAKGENSLKGTLVAPLRIVGGVLLILAGLVMLVLPGPGWLAIFGGIFLLGPDTRLARWLRRKFLRIRRWARRLQRDHKLRRQARRCQPQQSRGRYPVSGASPPRK